METPEKIKPKHSGTRPLFENPILEKLSRTHIAVPISIYLLIIVSMCYYALSHTNLSKGFILFYYFLGVLFFTLIEYTVHRIVFHLHPRNELEAKFQYTIHGIHHEYPKDKTRLAMPPVFALVLAAGIFTVFFVIMHETAYAFFPGFLTGYSGYLTIHFIIHAYKPPKNIFNWLWRNHSVHHYRNHEKNFGVSSPLWDYVFGTYLR